MKMPCRYRSARPPSSLGLLKIGAISLGKQKIATGSIRPPRNVWHDLLKKAEGTRLHFRQQMLASTSIGKHFPQVLIAPVWKTRAFGQMLAQPLCKCGNAGFHLLQLRLPRMGQASIHKEVGLDGMSGRLGKGRQQGTRSAMADQHQGTLLRD